MAESRQLSCGDEGITYRLTARPVRQSSRSLVDTPVRTFALAEDKPAAAISEGHSSADNSRLTSNYRSYPGAKVGFEEMVTTLP